MKQVTATFQSSLCFASAISLVATTMESVERLPPLQAPWANAFPGHPGVEVSIAYGRDSLFLQYNVNEKLLQAKHGRINEPVHEDSCVEFFISFDDAATYYNSEWNRIGTVLAGYGGGRHNRTLLPAGRLEQIQSQTLIIRTPGEEATRWQLTLSIPFSAFAFHAISSLQGQACRANFYKCGDALPEPHYLTWSPVQSPAPDFHLPQFFGKLIFV